MSTQKKEVINPLDSGVSYADFSKALGSSDIEVYLKGVCGKEQIDWIKKEMEDYKNLKKK